MAHQPPQLVLIDGSSLAYRAFYALPETIATSKGEATNAILGLAQMLTKLIGENGFRPTVVAWDAGHSGRREQYPGYKATRVSRPDLLKEQWPKLEPLCEAFGHINASLGGFEADDVIATLAERAKAQGRQVTIVTGDRDALQLVDEGVTVLATGRGVTDTKAYDREAVIERYGVPPELIPDLIGLKGDSSDNLPGVPGVGEKTAAALLQEFGSLEEVLAHIDQVKGPKRQENLREHGEIARLCRDLATAQRELPLELETADLPDGIPDPALLRETFRRWELREPLRRLEEALGGEATDAPVEPSGIEPTVKEGTAAAAAKLGKGPLAVAVAVPEAPEGALFADESDVHFAATADGIDVIAGVARSAAEVVEALSRRALVLHDAKALGTVPERIAHDTMIAAHLLDPARRGYPLEELALEAGVTVAGDDPAACDAVRTQALASIQQPKLAEQGLTELFEDVELPAIAVLRQMEQVGIRLDTDKLEEIAVRVRSETADLERQIHEQAGEEFSGGSPQPLGAILFEKLGLTKNRKGKTG
ncbi:MAG: 5'-3' exonuclease H3TH domain-containing protein [Actinomycetes bacterium]